MTSQPQPTPGDGRAVGPYLRPLRDLAAWVLVLAPAVLLLVAFIRLVPAGDGGQFTSRTQDSFYAFVNPATTFFPFAAVLLSVLVRPPHPRAKVITVLALAQYGLAAFFGVIFGILVGLVQIGRFSVRTAFEELLARAAWLAVFGLAAFAAYRIWRGLFHVPRPAPQPGVYGQPQYGVPGAHPGPPGYGQPPGGYGVPQWGGPGFGHAPQPGGSAWGQPAYGPPAQPGFGQAPVPHGPQGGQPPASAQPGTPPGPYAPGHAPAAYGPPAGAHPAPGPLLDPTRAVPHDEPTRSDRRDDHTEVVRDDRPGSGPADQAPPRH